jgi:hypothetical protein
VIRGRLERSGRLPSSHSIACRYTHVYVRKSDRWLMVAAHETAIDTPNPPLM